MLKCFKNKILASTIALIMGAIILLSPLTSYAVSRPSPFDQKGQVNGAGVRQRTAPVTGTILGLMYAPEIIYLNQYVVDNNYPAWCYIWRESTEQIGWMEWSYFNHQ
jgi:hypothetical protein